MAKKKNNYFNMANVIAIFMAMLALAYVFWSKDVIPDSIVSFSPTAIIGYLDDAVAIFAMIFTFRKLNLRAKDDPKHFWTYVLAYIPIGAVVVWYIFLGVDLIPDNTIWVGWFDDAAAIFVGMWTAGKIRQRLAKLAQ